MIGTASGLTLHLLRRTEPGDRGPLLLPVAAFAVVTALTLTVVGGAGYFFTIEGDEQATYRSLAMLAVILLVVPLLSLCGSAARLSARRRDRRLSTLRLLGASTSAVTVMTVLESTLLAVTGTLVGVVGHLLLAPVVGLVSFDGAPIGAGNVILGAGATVVCLVLLALLAAVSAVVGLRSVVVSPLGVRTRQDAPSMTRWRLVAFVAGLVVAFASALSFDPSGGVATIVAGFVVTFALTMAVLNLVGPFLLTLLARLGLRAGSGPVAAERLLAARTVLDSPKAAWRQVSGVALTSFVAVFAGVGLSFVDMVEGSGAAEQGGEAVLTADMRTGVLLTLVISFATVAAAVAVNQAAEVLDRQDLYVALDRMGMERRRVDRARVRAVLGPLVAVCTGSAAIAGVLISPLAVAVVGSPTSLLTAPRSLVVVALTLAAGIALVWAGLRSSTPLLRRVMEAPPSGP